MAVDGALSEVVSAGPYRIDLEAGRAVVARRRDESGSLRDVTPEEAATTDAMLDWRMKQAGTRSLREADRVKLSPSVIEALQREGYW